MHSPFVLVIVCLLGSAFGQSSSNSTLTDDKLDTMKKLEDAAVPLDSLPKSTVFAPTHEKTEAELRAEDPSTVFVGRDADSLTHPVITSKVSEEHVDRGNIQGRDALCSYLLDVTIGLEETNDLHADRLYDLAARLECTWTTCRMCQQRMYHVFDYCRHNGSRDWLIRGLCEDNNPNVEDIRLRKMIFRGNSESCRTWKDQQVLQVRCSPDDGAICQGAYTFAEVCHALGLNERSFLQHSTLESLAPWFCAKTMQCKEDRLLPVTPGVDWAVEPIGNEPGTQGLYLFQDNCTDLEFGVVLKTK